MWLCGSADVVTGNLLSKVAGVTGNLRIQNCESETADTTLIEGFV